jgi:hypothetical protein
MPSLAGPIFFFAAAIGAVPDLRIVGQPRIEGLRAIQAEYGAAGGLLFVEWIVVDGEFKSFVIVLNGFAQKSIDGAIRGIQLHLVPDSYRIELVGVWEGGEVYEHVDLEVLEASLVEQPTFYNCLFFGYDNTTFTGSLQISWGLPQRPDDPILETEIIVDDRVNGGEGGDRRYYRLFAPRTAITFAGIKEGTHAITLTGITRSYASEPVTVQCFAEGVGSPVLKSITPDCQDEGAGVLVRYEVPWGAGFTWVAAWASSKLRKNVFLGYWKAPEGWLSSVGEIRLSNLAEGPLDVELAGAKFDGVCAEEPYAISNLPTGDGEHVIGHIDLKCVRPSPFRRGDVTADGRINMADVISLLSYLFLTRDRPSCPASTDVDDSGKMEVTDMVWLLDYLFGGGDPPAMPGPSLCGLDPTPLPGETCVYAACAPPLQSPGGDGTNG